MIGTESRVKPQTVAAPELSEGAVLVAAHRLRKRYRAPIQDEIGQTVADPDQVGQEINDLFLALRPGSGAGLS
jgi:hypothetical protein